MQNHRYTKNQALRIVVECAKKYSRELLNRSLLLLCTDKHNNISAFELHFPAQHFLHLTGLKLVEHPDYAKGNYISANDFFSRCINRKLSINDFELSEDETTDMKLDVLPYIICKNLRINSIGDYAGNKPMLYTEKLAGGVKACVGFVKNKKGELIPNTLLKEDIRTVTSNTMRVIAVYRKPETEREYSEIVYLGKKIILSDFIFPAQYDYLNRL